MTSQAPTPLRRTSRNRRRWLAGVLAVVGIALVGGELGARLGLGLGDPPLSDAYPDLEYAFRPGTYRRFGNRVHINAHHMRSPEFPERKTRADEVRVMLMGDSVINGGALTDQADLASELLHARLSAELVRPVVVGNISAGSWGPGNLLAYARRFGLFDADAVVIIVNSEDPRDNPTGQQVVGVDPSFPDRKPWSALAEAVRRYGAPRVARLFTVTAQPTRQVQDVRDFTRGINDLSDLCDLAIASGASVLLVHFPNRAEIAGEALPGHDAIARLATQKAIRLIELRRPLENSLAAGMDPYRPDDGIHPNETGQRIIAEALGPAVVEVLGSPRSPDVP